MKFARTFGLLFVLAAVSGLLSGCGKGPSGKYVDPSGSMSFDFKSGGKVSVGSAGATQELDYTVDGDKVTIKGAGQTFEMTINGDGSLNAGPSIGTLKKK